MKTSMNFMTERDVEKMAGSDPQKTVMKAVYDHIFQPWPMDVVYRCVDRIKTCTLELRDKERVEEKIRADDELSRFVHDHKTLGSKLTDIAFCKDERAIHALLSILDIRNKMVQGKMTESDARSGVSEVALRAAMPPDAFPNK